MEEVGTFAGYVHKQSRHLKFWKIRYLQLSPSTLKYSKRSGENKKNVAKRQFERSLIQLKQEGCPVTHGSNAVFGIYSIPRKRWFYFSTPTVNERHMWCTRLSTTCAVQSPVLPTWRAPKMKRNRKEQYTTERKKERKVYNDGLKIQKYTIETRWLTDILPHYKSSNAEEIEALCFCGIPKQLRGRVWSVLLGNSLQINTELYDICRRRAGGVLMELNYRETRATNLREAKQREAKKAANVETTTIATKNEVPTTMDATIYSSTLFLDPCVLSEPLISDSERNIKLLRVDMPRTFGHIPFFKRDGVGFERLEGVLEAYTCYRPDLGYVQGMSYLAATLCFHMDTFTAFKALAALLSHRLHFDMYRLQAPRTLHYIAVFESVVEKELPKLYSHFTDIGIDAKMYMVDWALTLYTRCLPLEIVYRLWDVYLVVGSTFFFQASLGILHLLSPLLLTLEADGVMQTLHSLPQNVTAENIFTSIQSNVLLSRIDIQHLLDERNHQLWSPVESHPVEIQFPDQYE